MISAHPCKAHSLGFTLIEILVALSISAIAILAVFGIFSQVSAVAEDIAIQTKLGQAGRTLILRLRTDLHALYRPSGKKAGFGDQALFSGEQPPEDLLEAHTLLDFVSCSSLSFAPHFPKHSINRISYSLEPGGEENELYQLIRQEIAHATVPGDARRVQRLTMSRSVAAFELEFFQDQALPPQSSWNRDAFRPEDQIWPDVLAIRLTLSDGEAAKDFETLVSVGPGPPAVGP